MLEEALATFSKTIPDAEKAAFKQASKTIDERALLSDVQAYDAAHKDNSCFRPHAERLTKFLGLLNRFMGGVAIGVQANPEVSALVVGAVRIVIVHGEQHGLLRGLVFAIGAVREKAVVAVGP